MSARTILHSLLPPLVGLSVVGLGCKPKGELPVCSPWEVASERASEADTRILPAAVWFQQLVPNTSRPELLPPDDPRDCSSRQIAVTWPNPEVAARDPRAQAQQLPTRPLTDADLTFGEGPDGTLLVWARIAFYNDGTAHGPVALARWTARGLEIRGVGTLWAPERRARLRLEPLGEDDQVLVADAELCPPADSTGAKQRCRREVYLLPLRHQRFIQAELLEDGQAAGYARIARFEEHNVAQSDGWVRHSEIRRSLRFKDNKVTIAEAISIRDCDPNTGMKECENDRTSNYTRRLQWKDDRFSTTTSAWERAIAP